jgi:hypothetical protein
MYTAKATAKAKAAKHANIEVKFFGMIVLVWAVLMILFNLAHTALSQARKPAAARTTPAHSTRAAEVSSLR